MLAGCESRQLSTIRCSSSHGTVVGGVSCVHSDIATGPESLFWRMSIFVMVTVSRSHGTTCRLASPGSRWLAALGSVCRLLNIE